MDPVVLFFVRGLSVLPPAIDLDRKVLVEMEGAEMESEIIPLFSVRESDGKEKGIVGGEEEVNGFLEEDSEDRPWEIAKDLRNEFADSAWKTNSGSVVSPTRRIKIKFPRDVFHLVEVFFLEKFSIIS